MAYDEGLAQRLRELFADRSDVVEKKMFGGLAFMVRGHMSVGVNKADLMLRCGPDRYKEVLALPHAREMDFTKKPLKGFVYVDPSGFESDGDLRSWVDIGLDFATSMPAK